MSGTLRIERAALVYQAGIANVFEVGRLSTDASTRREGGPDRRMVQADFRTCENFARGLFEAGVLLMVAHCNEAGDVAGRDWSLDFDSAPFVDSMSPPGAQVSGYVSDDDDDDRPEPDVDDAVYTCPNCERPYTCGGQRSGLCASCEADPDAREWYARQADEARG